MFIWAKIPSLYQKSIDFVNDLFEQTGILFIPGIFSTNLPTKYPSGANEAVEPVGNAIPSKS